MADDWPNSSDDVLRGLFGGIVSAASSGRSAQTMWQAIKDQANSWAEGQLTSQGVDEPTDEEIAAKSRDLIGHVTVQDVNRYAKLAGEYLRAKGNLDSTDPNGQILSGSIFRAPWSKTAENPAIPERYRITIGREINYADNPDQAVTEWRTYELSGPLTTPEDAMQQANDLFNQDDYNASKSIANVIDFSLEAV